MEFQITGINSKSLPETDDNSKNIEKIKKEARAKGEYIVTVSGDEKGLTAIARRFNMSLSEFKKMTGLVKDALSKGQVIKNVPHAKIPDGKGLKYLAEQHGMTLDEILILNGLPKNYKPSKGEYFYVYPQKESASGKTTKETSRSVDSKTVTLKPVPKEKIEVSPKDIAAQIEEAVSSNFGAVGKEDFSKAFLQINDKNVKEVIKAYDELTGNKESLIDAICSEISSPQDLRKDAVMDVYDNLAKQTKASTPGKRQEFKTELDSQFNKLIGMVNTKKLDAIINDMIDNKPLSNPESFSLAKYESDILKTTNGGRSKDITISTMTTIKDRSGNYVTAGSLRKWALHSGKRDVGFRAVKDPFIVRPLPNYNTETKKIEAVTELREPTANGDLNGKLIILNPGHGGYQQKNGAFDPGTVLSVKNAEGEEMPIEEWRVAESFVNKLSDKLRSRGAQVLFIQGAVQKGGMSQQKKKKKMLAGNKGADEVRAAVKNTDKSDMLFLSVHVESAKDHPSSKLCTVRYTKGIDKKLAQNINKHINKGFPSLTPDVEPDGLYVNRATKGMPSSLLEIGNIANKTITNSLLSSYDQDKYMSCVADAIAETIND